MSARSRSAKVLGAQSALLALALTGCSGHDAYDDEVGGQQTLHEQRQALVDSIDSLVRIHGLTASAGLDSSLRLSADNGLKSVHGQRTLNGLSTVHAASTIQGSSLVNGTPAVQGLAALHALSLQHGAWSSSQGKPVDASKSLPVDCGAHGVPGETCWGTPDGLMNFRTGLLSSDAGIATAKYLIRCALPATQTVGFVDHTGTVIRMPGELELAPELYTGQCGSDCQEDISACLMALTNGTGAHVPVELSSTKDRLGGGHSSAFPYQEAAFYGNVFVSPPVAHYCVGADYAPPSWPGSQPSAYTTYSSDVRRRACAGYEGACPYAEDSACHAFSGFWPPPPAAACAFTGAVTTCARDWAGKPLCATNEHGTIDSASRCTTRDGHTFEHPITTYRKDKGAT